MNTIEKWKDIPGYEGIYAISDTGMIRRVSLGANGASKPGKLLNPRPMKSGYLRVNLGKGGVITDCLIHRLVLITFIGQPEGDKNQVNHKNGDKSDNRLINLEWVSQSQNITHAYNELGHKARGETNHTTHLTAADVLQIRAMAADGLTHKVIAEQFNITRRSVGRIVNRERWAHV